MIVLLPRQMIMIWTLKSPVQIGFKERQEASFCTGNLFWDKPRTIEEIEKIDGQQKMCPDPDGYRVKFLGSQPEMVLLEPSYSLLNSASIKGIFFIKQLEFELRKSNDQREVIARQRTDSQTEILWLKKDAEEQRKLKDAQKAAKDHLEAHQKSQEELNDAKNKLEEAEANAKARFNSVSKRAIYRAWLANLIMDISFLEDGAEEMLAFCEQTKKDERCF
uniref:Uncharacterized protein n=1 Tax=Cannabis sativa TaxID=3483 RepID=A0A803QB23_CANSA